MPVKRTKVQDSRTKASAFSNIPCVPEKLFLPSSVPNRVSPEAALDDDAFNSGRLHNLSARLHAACSNVPQTEQGAAESPSSGHRDRTGNGRSSAQLARGTQVRLAVTGGEHLRALALVQRLYRALGYTTDSSVRCRIQSWNLSKRAHTFLAECDGRVVGTVTCIEDGPAGLSAEATYGGPVQALRDRGARLCEVSAFAVDYKMTNRLIFLQLIRAITVYCRGVLGASDWVIVVHPRHVRFYTRMMLFEQWGALADCGQVNRAPGVLLRLNLDSMPSKYAARYGPRRSVLNLYRQLFATGSEQRVERDFVLAADVRRRNWPAIREVLLAEMQGP